MMSLFGTPHYIRWWFRCRHRWRNRAILALVIKLYQGVESSTLSTTTLGGVAKSFQLQLLSICGTFAFWACFAKVDLSPLFVPRSQTLLAMVPLLSAFQPSRFGPVLRRLKRFTLPPCAICGVFAKVDLSPLFVPRSQTILAMVPLLSAFQPSRFGPVLRRVKRFSLPPCAICGVFAKVCILYWEAEHYNTFCKWHHRQ